jgi:two-component system sensor histidine kinase KdpD
MDKNVQKKGIRGRARLIVAGKKDYIITLISFVSVTIVSFFFLERASDPTLNIAMLYTIGAFIAARYTEGYLYGIIYALGAVLAVNFFFTYPYGTLNFGIEGYHVTFLGMLIISLFTSVSSSLLKSQQDLLSKQEKELAEAEKEKMRANLLRAVSHDLRTPLTGIIGNSESILENGENMTEEEKMRIVSSIDSDARWLLNMVENLLSVTRIDDTEAGVNKTPEIVDEVVSAAVSKFKRRFPGTEVIVRVPEKPVMVEMDALLIQQVLINIMHNAKVHSQSTGPIEVKVAEEGSEVSFSIRDHGIGIPEDKLETIFDGEGLGEVQSSPDGYKGMGIGLSICKTIIRAHGGQIEAKNLEEGAEFVFRLPAYIEEIGNESEDIGFSD